MSTAKRLRRSQNNDGKTAPAAKRVKVSKTSHVPARAVQGLDFLVDEDARNGRKLEARLTNGKFGAKGTRVDESRAVVAPDVRDGKDGVGGSPKNAIDISSAEEESDEEEEEEEEDDDRHAVNGTTDEHPMTNGHISKADDIDAVERAAAGAEDVDMADQLETVDEDKKADDREEPSFGDLLQARHPDPIDVHSAFPDLTADRLALTSTTANITLSAPSGTTLRTVLTQALKTNDRDLLERCFQTTNLTDIRLTIERLASHHVATLLQRLAERIHKRPGRTGNLITWVQWALVAHGAFLASQPEVMKKLRSLSQVLRERANGLQPLLRLKGKLDMLQAQLELRQRLQAASRGTNAEIEDEEDGVVYVEGRDEDWTDGMSEAGVDDVETGMLDGGSLMKGKGQTATPKSDASESGEESESESETDMPNGVAREELDESDEDDGANGLLDIEAEETSDDDDDAEEVEDSAAESRGASDAEETDASGDESESGVKEPKPQMLNRKR